MRINWLYGLEQRYPFAVQKGILIPNNHSLIYMTQKAMTGILFIPCFVRCVIKTVERPLFLFQQSKPPYLHPETRSVLKKCGILLEV